MRHSPQSRSTSVLHLLHFFAPRNNEKYISGQTAKILEMVKRFDIKLYLEFGGKLLFVNRKLR